MPKADVMARNDSDTRRSRREWRAMILRKTGVVSIASLVVIANLLAPLGLHKLSRFGEPAFGIVVFCWVACDIALLAMMASRYRRLQKLHPWSPTAPAEDYMRS